MRLRLIDHPAGAATVSLEPTGKVVGRLLDKEGEPLSGAEITASILPTGDFTERLPPIATDEQGRFEYNDVPVGCHYQLVAQAAGKGFFGSFAKDLTLKPGETKDLGEVTYGRSAKPDQKPAKEPATDANSLGHSTPLRVRVVDDNDQPIADARVRVLRLDSHPVWVESVHVLGESHTNEAGEAAIDYSALAPFATQDVLNSSRFLVLADARGCALDWSSLPAEDTATLRLLRDDVPIEGRVLDLEGRPIRGVRVSVFWVEGGAENIDAWIKLAQNNPEVVDPIDPQAVSQVAIYPGQRRLAMGPPSALHAVVTDEHGRFRLDGLGATGWSSWS